VLFVPRKSGVDQYSHPKTARRGVLWPNPFWGRELSQLLINQYLADLDRLRRVSGANRESVVREAFKDLLKAWGRSRDLQFIPEHEYITPTKATLHRRRPIA
jgi:hypothetical protein